jgi:hypothetical protein
MNEEVGSKFCEEAGKLVDQEVQTEPVVPNGQGKPWLWQVLCALVLLFVGFVSGVFACYKVFAALPNFRGYMFGEQEVVNTVTKTEQIILTTFNLSLLSLFSTACLYICNIFTFLQNCPWVGRKILELTSWEFGVKIGVNKIREYVVKNALLPMLKNCVCNFLKTSIKIWTILICTMLMIIGLHSIMEQYNFAFHMYAFVSRLRGAIPCV